MFFRYAFRPYYGIKFVSFSFSRKGQCYSEICKLSTTTRIWTRINQFRLHINQCKSVTKIYSTFWNMENSKLLSNLQIWNSIARMREKKSITEKLGIIINNYVKSISYVVCCWPISVCMKRFDDRTSYCSTSLSYRCADLYLLWLFWREKNFHFHFKFELGSCAIINVDWTCDDDDDDDTISICTNRIDRKWSGMPFLP